LRRLLELGAALERPWNPQAALGVNRATLRVVRFEGWFDKWHTHAEDECYVVLEGEVLVAMDGNESVRLGVGDAYLVRAGTVHRPMGLPSATVLLVT
jgi:mannose-6-phosphate isomerase-like protein (cupin superfamily)